MLETYIYVYMYISPRASIEVLVSPFFLLGFDIDNGHTELAMLWALSLASLISYA